MIIESNKWAIIVWNYIPPMDFFFVFFSFFFFFLYKFFLRNFYKLIFISWILLICVLKDLVNVPKVIQK